MSSTEALVTHVLDALRLGLVLAAPALIASVAVGLISGFFQALTQVQDAALSFVPRLLAVAVVLGASAAWMSSQWVAFTQQLWHQISALAT